MSALIAFYDLLLPELPGCTSAMVNFQLREVAREFCTSTNVWRHPLTAISLVANQSTYTMPVPANSEVVRVVSLTKAGDLLWADVESDDDTRIRPKYGRHEPPYTLSSDLLQIVLAADEVPTAALASGLVLVAALKPTAAASDIPDFILNQYSEAIRCGVLSRMLFMSKKPWSDPGLAGVYAKKWAQEMTFAAFQGRRGSTRAPLRVKKWM